MNRLLFDTCFLIDLERELKRKPSCAQAFLRDHSSSQACVSWTVVGEFSEGFEDIRDDACTSMLARFDILPMDAGTAGSYARITRLLRAKKALIGTNDLWIAAAAMAYGLPLVTNNTTHFSRIPGLSLMAY